MRLCPKCGYENTDGAALCSHCNASLPSVDAPKTEPSKESGGKLQMVDIKTIEAETKLAEECMGKGDLDLAGLVLRNASALNVLTEQANLDARSQYIANLQKRLETLQASARRTCVACGGTGKRAGGSAGAAGASAPCVRCSGMGQMKGAGKPSERKSRIAKAIEAFKDLEQGRSYLSEGNVWVPRDVSERLTIPQRALLRRAAPVPCSNCLGLGVLDCTICRGLGESKCTVTGCVGGKVVVEEYDSLTRGKLKKVFECRTCGGKGSILCAECHGSGAATCAACSGSGQRATCPDCDGQGYGNCKRCKGTGSVTGGKCPDCRGETVSLCATCRGDGRKR